MIYYTISLLAVRSLWISSITAFSSSSFITHGLPDLGALSTVFHSQYRFIHFLPIDQECPTAHQISAIGIPIAENAIIIPFSIFVISCLLDVPVNVCNCTCAGGCRLRIITSWIRTASTVGIEDVDILAVVKLLTSLWKPWGRPCIYLLNLLLNPFSMWWIRAIS